MVQNRNLLFSGREVLENTDSCFMELKNHNFRDAPLTALSDKTLRKLSNLLNNLMIIHSSNGYERDWRGLAALTEQRSLCDHHAQQTNDPFKKLLELWCENNANTATFGNLITYLGLIDRWHVIEDIEDNLRQDFKNYQQASTSEQNIATSTTIELPLITNEKTLTTTTSSISELNANEKFTYASESKVLTSNDVLCYQNGLPLVKYDAFVLYADNDYNYALEILIKLQNNPVYNFKFCLKDDLLFGIPFEHIALMELIRERCKFLIVILTKEFTNSPENRFFVNYAQALQIKQEIRKVIPLMYEDQVDIPANLAMFSRMRYNPKRTDLYWSKLADSIKLLQLGEAGVTQYSTTFRSQRSQPINLAVESRNFHAANTTSLLEKRQKGLGKSRTSDKKKSIKLKERQLRNTNEFGIASGEAGSICSHHRTRGIFRKLFCCC